MIAAKLPLLESLVNLEIVGAAAQKLPLAPECWQDLPVHRGLYQNPIATRYVGKCGVCEGDFKLTHASKHPSVDSPGFRLVHHGYKRPGDGEIHGDCYAVGMAPYEVSAEPTEQYLKMVDRQLAQQQEYLERLENGEITELRKDISRAWGKPEYKLLTPADGWEFKSELQTRIHETEYRIQNLHREAARLESLIHHWQRLPVRTIEEETEKKRAAAAERQDKLQVARDARQAKRDAIDQKNVAREQERLDLMNEYREIFNQLAFDGSPAAKKEAVVHWVKMQKRKRKKSYLNFIEPDLDIDQTLMALGLAVPRRNPHGRWQYNYANDLGWEPRP